MLSDAKYIITIAFFSYIYIDTSILIAIQTYKHKPLKLEIQPPRLF